MATRPRTGRVILRKARRSTLDALKTREERLAFWIDVYNALVAEGISSLGIRESVWEVADFFERVSYRVGDLLFSPDEIEHGVLRGNRPHPLTGMTPFEAGDPRLRHAMTPLDPRIHFAISCGARSCPTVRIYHSERLDEQLDAAARTFVNEHVALEGGRLTASELFRWFRADFDDFPGGLAGVLTRYLDDGPVRWAVMAHGVAGIAWRPYDWRLELTEPRPAGGGD